MDDYMTVKQAAAALKVNEATVRKWIKAGKFPGWQRAGERTLLIPRHAVIRLAAIRKADERK